MPLSPKQKRSIKHFEWSIQIFMAICCGAFFQRGDHITGFIVLLIIILIHFMDIATGETD